jgi:hypothetical protein
MMEIPKQELSKRLNRSALSEISARPQGSYVTRTVPKSMKKGADESITPPVEQPP